MLRGYLVPQHDALALSTIAGLLSLVAYAVWGIGLARLLGLGHRSGSAGVGRAALVGMAGALGGTVLAAVGQASVLVLVLNDGIGDASSERWWSLALGVRLVAGWPTALGLAGFAIAAARARVLPAALAAVGRLLAAALFVATVLAVALGGEGLRLTVLALFALAAAWVFAVRVVLLLVDGRPASYATRGRQVLSLVLVVAAGVTGVALLVLPAATAQLFSWGLKPHPLAALIGGCYVASAVVFAIAVGQPVRAVRGLVVGAVVLAVTTTVATLAHLDTFDFDRVQAIAWVVLFPGFAVAAAVVLATEHSAAGERPLDARLAPFGRALGGALGALAAIGALALWIDPAAAGDPLPFALSPLGGRFLGCWLAFLSAVTVWAVARATREEARLPAVTLAAFPLAALLALARSGSELTGATAIVAYIAGLSVWLAAALLLCVATRAETAGALS